MTKDKRLDPWMRDHGRECQYCSRFGTVYKRKTSWDGGLSHNDEFMCVNCSLTWTENEVNVEDE